VPRRTDDRRDTSWFIEQLGRSAEADGLTRIAGRLFAALLMSEEPRCLDDLAADLGVSKASVSTDARRLLERGVVERRSVAGDRRDYYQLAPDFFTAVIRHRLERWGRSHRLVAEMEHAARGMAPVVRDRLAYLEDADRELLRRLHDAVDDWEMSQRRRRTAPAKQSGSGTTRGSTGRAARLTRKGARD
jgi:DNA-binding transcriptional regulator GbsR (MarR family)